MRKFYLILLFGFGFRFSASAQYWQQQVDYKIDITLNDRDKTIEGFEKLKYRNNSPDTLRYIWFHLWPNAYKNDKTAFSDQLLENGDTRFYFSSQNERGYINRLDFKVNGLTAETEDHPQYIDILKVILPTPLLPGQTADINTPFFVRLPYNYSRIGHVGESFQLTQWYPKPAVYDAKGWHPIPYLDQGEFYSEFGNYDVTITLPENYVVAGTGELQNAEEKKWLQTRSNFTWTPVVKKTKLKTGTTKKITQIFPTSSTKTKTIQFLQDNVHDFAWFADKRFVVKQDTCALASGKLIQIYSFSLPISHSLWPNALTNAKSALHFYSSAIGDYPYNTLSLVQGPQATGGGMEYPTITVIAPLKSAKTFDRVIAHEIGHNWFYSAIANNERAYPWMDEGINSFFERKYIESKYGDSYGLSNALYESRANTHRDQPIGTSAEKFSGINYVVIPYYKTSEWLRWLESSMGPANFRKAIQDYYAAWKYKHPQPDDFRKIMSESAGLNTDSMFSALTKTGLLPSEKNTATSIGLIFQPSHFKHLTGGTLSRTKQLITIGPAIGFNSYDKLMIGAFITNYKLPPTAFKYFLAPMYATGSGGLSGMGTIHYTAYPRNGIFHSLDFFLNGAIFNADRYQDSAGRKTYLGVRKLVPGFRFLLNEKNPRSNRIRYIQGKIFLIGEDALKFGRDTIINGQDTSYANTYSKIAGNRALGQLDFNIENYRALYPYQANLRAEFAKDFIRLAFTGNYFFNYSKGGGLQLRLFAGKFIYTTGKTESKQFNTDRYHLNMTGPNGYEDYTYSNYFAGRNKFDDLASQQIMMRDGGFKTRTDLLASKIGKTDDWLAAVNFTSSIFPHIPIKIFADAGTYADAWKKDASLDHFLFEAGLQISLLKETVNIYLPLVYSSELKNYIQSYLPKKDRLLKTISFSIDIQGLTLRKLNRHLVF